MNAQRYRLVSRSRLEEKGCSLGRFGIRPLMVMMAEEVPRWDVWDRR
jgi:hypothetical protein